MCRFFHIYFFCFAFYHFFTGANPNVQVSRSKNVQRIVSPLQLAVELDNFQLTFLLLYFGANPSIENGQRSLTEEVDDPDSPILPLLVKSQCKLIY